VFDKSLRSEIAQLQNPGAKSEFGTAGDDRPPESESHVNRLLNLLKKLKSINERADNTNFREGASARDFDLLVIAALREAECADLIEKTMEADLTSLCSELTRKDETLQAREMAMVRLEETSKAQLAELESRVQGQENQLKNLETEQQKLTAERDRLAHSLSAAELAARQADADARQFKERMNEEFSSLKLQTAKREQFPEAKRPDPHRPEGDQKKEIETLQLRLQETEAKLASQEKELKEKERTIHAAGVRETELGKLIERLSAECEKLSAELCEKKLMISRFEDETRASFLHGGKAWERVARLVRAGRDSSRNSNHS
jgi:DNA repair exonuclease SbcCD ATPase subunit